MAGHNELGTLGEEIASGHLKAKSYTILERNWRSGRMEVDIIARLGNELVIAEVKSRHRDYLGSPLDAVNRKKQKLLIRAANAYISKMGLDMEVRFDIIVVIFTKKTEFEVHHIENAFYPVAGN